MIINVKKGDERIHSLIDCSMTKMFKDTEEEIEFEEIPIGSEAK